MSKAPPSFHLALNELSWSLFQAGHVHAFPGLTHTARVSMSMPAYRGAVAIEQRFIRPRAGSRS